MITVKDKSGNVRCEVEVTDKCVYSKALMEEEYVLLSFVSDVLIDFAKEDYIDTDFGRFRIVTLEKPTLASNGGYQYEQKFHVEWERLRNRLLFYDRQRDSEKSWKMTQTPEYFLDIVIGNIYNAGYGRYSYEVDATLTEMKLVEFDATNIIDALTKIAEAWETEWWISDKVIHLSKCEFGSPVRLETGVQITDMQREDGQDQKYYTRLYAFGSTRNLPKNYRKNSDGSTVVEGIVETRLKLPSGTPYIDAWEGMSAEDIIEAVEVFEDVYPRRVGTISTVTPKEYTDEEEDENGNKTYVKWNAFRFTDKDFTFSEDYILEGEDLRIVFQSGKLAGMDFAVKFNPEGAYEKTNGSWNRAAQVFEIIRNDDYGVDLPADDFKPSVGDTYILYGFNIQLVAGQYVPAAEKELLEVATEKLAEASQDQSVYTCPTNPIRCAGYTENTSGQLQYSSANIIDLDMGQSVALYDPRYFKTGFRLSRVRGFEKRLDNKFNCTYTVGESSVYSLTEDISEQVESLTIQNKTLSNTYGSPISLVRRYDVTAPTDNNVFSSKRSMYEFLMKNVADRAMERIIFEKGVQVGTTFDAGETGGLIDGSGNGELLSLVVRSLLRSPVYTHGFNGEGWRLWLEDGLSHLELDRLTVRQIMTVFELVIDRIRAVGGQIIVSAANGKIKEVTEGDDTYAITFEGDNYFVAGDLMRCQVFTGQNIRGYWVEVAGVNGSSIVVNKSEFADWGTEPQVGDECVLMGNTSNTDRQNFISISATEDGQPRIDIMDGVSSKTFEGCLRARLGNLDGINDDWFPLDNQPHGNGLYADNAYLRGTFLLTTGEDIKTKFEIVEGKISSSVEGLRQDFMQDKGFLNNPTFSSGLDYWTAENETVFFLLGKRWIWANSNVLGLHGDGASVIDDDGRKVVFIRNKYIKQTFANFRGLPEITVKDGYKQAAPVYLSFFYKVKKAGTLTIGFENVDNTGFEGYEPFSFSQEMAVTDQYQQLSISGLWNATGDFKLAFTGEINIYMLVLSTDRIEALTHTYRTLFEQSETLVRFAADNLDANGNILASSSIVTSNNFESLFELYKNQYGLVDPNGVLAQLQAKIADGTIMTVEAFAGMFAAAVTENGIVKSADIAAFITADDAGNLISNAMIRADQITLEGIVTANGNFKILEDGSMVASNGTFNGTVNATAGYIGGFAISSTHIGAANVTVDSSGNVTVSEDTYGLSLYDQFICFNHSDGRQAILGTWDNFGQPMLLRLSHSKEDKNYGMPRVGIVFDIQNQWAGRNYAFIGNGIGALNAMIEGYAYKKITMDQSNTYYNGYMNVKVANRFLLSSSATPVYAVLPDLGTVRDALGVGTTTPFCVRITIICDLNSSNCYVTGRNSVTINSAQPYNGDTYPLLTHQNGGMQSPVEMAAGDTLEVLLVYDPDRTDTISNYSTNYTARIINKLS